METTISEKSISTHKRDQQNLISLIILLLGLLIGSLFIDIAQLVSKSGFSKKVISENNILPAGGKTWVAFSDPEVSVQVITDSDCKECAPNQALLWLRRILPTISIETIEYGSFDGQKLIAEHSITALPAFLFSKKVTDTTFFFQAGELFSESNGVYLFDMKKIGQTPGKFLKLPEVTDEDISVGNKGASLTVIEYSDFQCPYCKLFHTSIKEMLKEYSSDVRYIYKHLPLSFHPQAENAALASACANDQGKFTPYSDTLFEKQDDWSKTTGTGKFKDYARILRLNTRDFNTCLDTKKHLSAVIADAEEARSFGITGTPGVFIGERFIGGAISYDELKQAIDTELAK